MVKLGVKLIVSSSEAKKAIDNYVNTNNIDYIVPIYIGTTNNVKGCVLCIIVHESRDGLTTTNSWIQAKALKDCEEYKEEIIDINHEGQSFKLDLSKARKLGLIK